MAGRDEKFKDQLRAQAAALPGGAVDLGAIPQGPPDPRTFPATYHETTFRQCYEEWTIMRNEEGKVLYYRLTIVDPIDRHVYHYGFNDRTLEAMLAALTEMKNTGGDLADEVLLVRDTEGEPVQ